jgi:hypothetical protein
MRTVLRLALAAAVSASVRASADESDYRADNTAWNGLSDLYALARDQGITPETRALLDWDQLGPGDGVLVLYPRVRLDPARLEQFVRLGGHALVADDFGAAGKLFAAFGISRAQPPKARVAEGRDSLPIALGENHPLARGVSEVVANHATALSGAGQPVASFQPGAALALELPLGRGSLVLCGDPSIFINNMLAFPGNHTFAQNLLGTLARPGGRLVVVSQEFAEQGTPRAHANHAREAGSLHDFNDFLHDLASWVPEDAALRTLALAATLAALALLLLGWRGGGRTRPSFACPHDPGARLADPKVLLELVREDVEAELGPVAETRAGERLRKQLRVRTPSRRTAARLLRAWSAVRAELPEEP